MFTPTRQGVASQMARQVGENRTAQILAGSRVYEQVDTWHTFGEDSTSSIGAGWQEHADYGPPQFLLDPLGFVHLRGALQFTTGGVMATLPEGLRHSLSIPYFTWWKLPPEPGPEGVAIVTVFGSGDIDYTTGTLVANGVVTLDGIIFHRDAG